MKSYGRGRPVILYGASGKPYAEKVYKSLTEGSETNEALNDSFILGDMNLTKFPNGEPDTIIKTNIRERDVYIIQSMCSKDEIPPVPAYTRDKLVKSIIGSGKYSNLDKDLIESLAEDILSGLYKESIDSSGKRMYDAMELLAINDAAMRASANKVVNVITNFPFARQDRKARGRQPITARMYADMLEGTGADRVITIDLHADQEQGFFGIPCDNLYAYPFFLNDVIKKYGNLENIVFVYPDLGSKKRIGKGVKKLPGYENSRTAVIDKERETGSKVKTFDVIGKEAVAKKHAIIIDDEVDTSGTLEANANSLMYLDNPPDDITFYATHGTLSDPATERIQKLYEKFDGRIDIVISDSIPYNESYLSDRPWLRVKEIYPIVAHTMDKTARAKSVSSLFTDNGKIKKIVEGTRGKI